MSASNRRRWLFILWGILLAGCQIGADSALLVEPGQALQTSTLAAQPTPAGANSLSSRHTATIPHEPAVTESPDVPGATPLPSLPDQAVAAPSETPRITPTPEPEITLLFTGVIVPARCVQAAIDARGDPDFPYAEVRALTQAVDLAVGTLNATISDYPPHTGCIPTYVLVGGPENADALARAGFDVMSVATNHIKNCGLPDCGDRAFFDTLANLRRVGILPVGAGVNHAEAMQPVVVELGGVRFGFVSLGQIEPTAFAGEDTPGIAVLNTENLQAAIAAARRVADVVIAMPHWGPEDVPWPNYLQRDLAQQLVAAGADIVVGNHTHVVQAVQQIDGVPIFYGLGNFVFDQDLNDHQQGAILLLRFRGAQYTGFSLVPTHVDQDGTLHYAERAETAEILARVSGVSRELGYHTSLGYHASLPADALARADREAQARALFDEWLAYAQMESLPPAERLFDDEILEVKLDENWAAHAEEFGVEYVAEVVFSVRPVTMAGSYWVVGNGEVSPDGWVRRKRVFVGVRRLGGRYWLDILGTGL